MFVNPLYRQVMDPGLIGGLVLPVLGALPDSAMIVVSGLAGSIEQAKVQVFPPKHTNSSRQQLAHASSSGVSSLART